ncbi:MAG: hypothetical protein GY807_03060, partial [Gammaproteobacteria bacterium]|nr:hypothetical protein [Gammaproteobacteria bacterium]
MKKIGVIIETENGKVKATNYGMITLAGAPETELSAFVLDVDADAVKQDLESYGIVRIFD